MEKIVVVNLYVYIIIKTPKSSDMEFLINDSKKVLTRIFHFI